MYSFWHDGCIIKDARELKTNDTGKHKDRGFIWINTRDGAYKRKGTCAKENTRMGFQFGFTPGTVLKTARGVALKKTQGLGFRFRLTPGTVLTIARGLALKKTQGTGFRIKLHHGRCLQEVRHRC